jgi:hypothetical protein
MLLRRPARHLQGSCEFTLVRNIMLFERNAQQFKVAKQVAIFITIQGKLPLFLRWLRLSEQNFRVDKWRLCRVRPPRETAAG